MTSSQKKWFLTFANELFYGALERIEKQAMDSQLFDQINIYKDTDLPSFTEFWETHRDFIIKNQHRGYGYWIWKPFLIMKTLEEMNENDILIYADSGCEINPYGKLLMDTYIQLVNLHSSGVLSFRIDNYFWNKYNPSEKNYTKMDLLRHLECESLLETQQLHTISIIRKCEYSQFMVKLWYTTCCQYHLIDDSPSILPNHPEFLEHRHDQSVWSLIRKKYGSVILNDQVQGKQNQFIWCTRNKTNKSLLPDIQKIKQINRKIAYVVFSEPSADVFLQKSTSLFSQDAFYIENTVSHYFDFFTIEQREYDYYVFMTNNQFIFPLRLQQFLLDKCPDDLTCYCHAIENKVNNVFHVISKSAYKRLSNYIMYQLNDMKIQELLSKSSFDYIISCLFQENQINIINEPLMIFDFNKCIKEYTNNYTQIVINNVQSPNIAHYTWIYLDNFN
jgi:hypothetical protein